MHYITIHYIKNFNRCNTIITPNLVDKGWCHVKGTAYRVKFINSKCVEIEQNHTSSCSLPIATYESILVFSY